MINCLIDQAFIFMLVVWSDRRFKTKTEKEYSFFQPVISQYIQNHFKRTLV
jgi:hypothetical protein